MELFVCFISLLNKLPYLFSFIMGNDVGEDVHCKSKLRILKRCRELDERVKRLKGDWVQ